MVGREVKKVPGPARRCDEGKESTGRIGERVGAYLISEKGQKGGICLTVTLESIRHTINHR